ncbi:MAG: molybdopterin molybdotransferase MoeA [Clostridiales bacterium]|nr:molybdopterin molybdotransferase MoeA [Clostridiales bacterium]
MLNVVTKDEAAALVREKSTKEQSCEKVNIHDSLCRVLAEDIVSDENIPSFDRTTVDGYAVISSDTFGASPSIPAQLEITGEILMGEKACFELKKGQCAKISTGGMLPKGADAAAMVEHTDNAEGICLIYKSVAPSENITKKGDDVAAGQTALNKGTVIGPAQIAVLAALGISEIPVYVKPIVAVISTGDEITADKPSQGQIRDINTFMLSSALRKNGCEVIEFGAVKDKREEIENAVKSCIKKADAILISGGSSAGTRDMTVDIISSLGEVFFHGIAMKPGKPTIFGMIDGKPVFGLPGHPLAAYFVFRLIVSEYIKSIMGLPGDKAAKNGILSVNIPSNHGREEYLCVKYNENNEVVPVYSKSGIVSVLSEAEGFIRIDRNTEGLFRGTTVEIYEL